MFMSASSMRQYGFVRNRYKYTKVSRMLVRVSVIMYRCKKLDQPLQNLYFTFTSGDICRTIHTGLASHANVCDWQSVCAGCK